MSESVWVPEIGGREPFATCFADAGASHVVVTPIHPDEERKTERAAGIEVDWRCLEALAPS